jgi:hypothetical protein
MMQTGTIRHIVEKLLEQAKEDDDIRKYKERLEKLPAPEFPYGGVIMLKAKTLGKKCVLITNLHRHSTSFTDAATSVDGFMLLLPLIEAGIVTAEQVSLGEADCYMSDAKKEDPNCYRIAISRLLKQKK